MMVELTPVDSSMIAAVGYDAENKVLIVLFNSGKAYEYYDVPSQEYQGLMSAESKGSYMNSKIIDVYAYAPFHGWKKSNA